MGRVKVSVTDHDKIVHAIQEGLPDEADRLLQLHILNLGGELRRMFSVLSTSEWSTSSNQRPIRVRELEGLRNVQAK